MPLPCACFAAVSASRPSATSLVIGVWKLLASICGSISTCCGRSPCQCPGEAIMTDDLSSTPLGRWITKWLAHQRALGRGYDKPGWILQHLQRFVVTRLYAPDLDQAGFDLWCDSLQHLAATTRRSRQLAVRKFCLFRRRAEPDCFVPDPLYFARLCPYRRPVIIEPQQVAQMLVVADGLAPTRKSP